MLAQGALLVVLFVGMKPSQSREIHDVDATTPAKFEGDYLVFGWSQGMDPIDDYPSYTGTAVIRHDGKVWKMVQRRGQKVAGGAKEESRSVGTAGDGFLSLGWGGSNVNGFSVGSSEYFTADGNTLLGPWTQIHNGGVGFEELIRKDSVEGYYVDLHTDAQKRMRADAMGKHVAASGTAETFAMEDWIPGKDGTESVVFQGAATAKAAGVTVKMVSDFMGTKNGREFVGLIDDESRAAFGWLSVDGQWGSAKYHWSNGALEGSWTTFGSAQLGFGRLQPVL